MFQALAGRGGRVLGRSLLTLANVITVAAPLAADCPTTRIFFNERWPAHARFHAVTRAGDDCRVVVGQYLVAVVRRERSSPGNGFSRPPFRSLTGRRSSWPPWCPALQSMIRRTRSSVWQACRSVCWARRPPPPQPPLAGSSTADLPGSRQPDYQEQRSPDRKQLRTSWRQKGARCTSLRPDTGASAMRPSRSTPDGSPNTAIETQFSRRPQLISGKPSH